MKKLLVLLAAVMLVFTLSACEGDGIVYYENEVPTTVDCYIDFGDEIIVLENVLEELDEYGDVFTIVANNGQEYLITPGTPAYCVYNPNPSDDSW